MKYITDSVVTGLLSLTFVLAVTPLLRKFAQQVGLTDKPNYRKLHAAPIPLVGGLAIAMAVGVGLIINIHALEHHWEFLLMLCIGTVLLVTGVIDDYLDIPARIKLFIQLACAYGVAVTPLRITSLYGLFGIHDIPLVVQYLLTIIVTTGVVNAFNLMDGIDGLAGSLGLVGFIGMGAVAYFSGSYHMIVLFSAFVGALMAFLYFNLGRKKIFMGDGGSLYIGFMLVVSGLYLLKQNASLVSSTSTYTLLTVMAIFLIPVLDSLRVYRARIKNGDSPFTPDRSHLHHLFLDLGITHKQVVLAIVITVLSILVLVLMLSSYLNVTAVLGAAIGLFVVIINILGLNKQVITWREKIKQLENR